MWQWEEVKQISVGGFRAVVEFGAGGDHRLCPETFEDTLGRQPDRLELVSC